MYKWLFLLLFFPFSLVANITPINLTSTIQKVTVFKQGAQITRAASTIIPKGKKTFKFSGLPLSLDTKSLQLKAEGAFTVLAVQHLLHIDTQLVDQITINRLSQSNDSLTAIMEEWQLELDVLLEAEALILDNNKVKHQNDQRLTIDELKSMTDFYQNRLGQIRLGS